MIFKKPTIFWCVVVCMAAASAVTFTQAQAAEAWQESDLIAVLQSNAEKGEKAITCKRLAIYGTDRCVPVVAPLLADMELSSWARITLEAIPGPVADAALRDAMGKVKGRLLVGVINSIAVRRDGRAVDPLIKTLGDPDEAVASAAAVALGHLGGEPAGTALTRALANAPTGVRSAVAQGCILCAEGFMANRETAKAIALYDAVRQADVPVQRHLEALRGVILARGDAGLPLLVEQLRSQDKKRLSIGLRTARELGGQKVTEALADELAQLSPDRRPLLLLALSDRTDSAVLPTILTAAGTGSKDVRLTAINILVRLGNVSCMPVLLEAATGTDAELSRAAIESIIRMADKAVDTDVVARLKNAQGKQQRVLVEVAGQRQISEAVPAVVSSLKSTDVDTRATAVRAIGIIGQAPQAGDLVALLQTTRNASERAGIRTALQAICGRYGVTCLPLLQPLIKSRDNDLQVIGLSALAIIGGPDALGAVKSAIANGDASVQDEAVRILSTWPNSWPDDSEAGKALLALASSDGKMSHQVLGLRGYLQYVRGSKALSNEQKVTEVEALLTHIKRPEETRQAIAVLGESPCASALDRLTALTTDASVAEEAYSAMVVVSARNVRGISADRRRQVLQTVIEKSKNDGTKQRARRALRDVQ
ncbi:MAG: hypothetical protein K9N55_06700 [Phycisphaerae bacterium]|nr:hypothetical protein [Phycisphaerae bacterium]